MNEKLNYIKVEMNCVDVSTEETPIIGTTSLGPCVGILLYNEKLKKTVVAHVSSNWEYLMSEIFMLLCENEFLSTELASQCYEIYTTLQKYILNNALSDTKFIEEIVHYVNKLPNIKEENKIEYLIIPGSMKNNYQIDEKLKIVFESLSPIFNRYQKELPKDAIKRVQLNEELDCNEFYFDSSTGTFVTNKINIIQSIKIK